MYRASHPSSFIATVAAQSSYSFTLCNTIKVMKLTVRPHLNHRSTLWSAALLLVILTVMSGCAPSTPRFPPMRANLCTDLSQEQDLSHIASRAQNHLVAYRAENQRAYRDALRKLRVAREQSERQQTKTEKSLYIAQGDRFPSISLDNSELSKTSLRLDPSLRRHDVVSIDKIAISPKNKQVAVITKTRFSDTPLLLILDSKGLVRRTVRLPVYDILWADDQNLIISTGTLQPDRVYSIRGDDALLELQHSARPGQPLVLSRSRTGTLFSIEERSAEHNTLTIFDSKTPQRKILQLQAPLAGSRCEYFNHQVVCLSFSNNPQGDIVAFSPENPTEQTLIKRGTDNTILQGIDADEHTFVVFARENDHSTLYAYQSLTTTPQKIPSSTPTSSFSSGPKISPREPVMIAIRSPLFPTTFVSIDKLSSLGVSHLSKPTFCSACREELLYAEAADGTLVPISLITPQAPKGLLIKAYGSYGVSLTPEYSIDTRALLESGIALAFIHVRGGGERGHTWHIEGSGANKLRGMSDLRVATRRVQNHLGLKANVTIGTGTSAGGWLMIRTALEDPKLFSALILEAPLIEPSLGTSHPTTFEIDSLEWHVSDKHSYSTNLSEYHSANLFPRVLALLPLRDSVIPASKTLTWLNQLGCTQTRSVQDFIYIDYGGEHSHASSAEAQTTWEALKHIFMHSVVAEARVESEQTSPINEGV